MMRRLKFWLVVLGLSSCWHALAQTNSGPHGVWVTNWVDAPPSLRMAKGRSYNTLISPRWQWLVLSNNFREAGDDGLDHAITNAFTSQRMTITTSATNAIRDELHLTVFHYPFNPTNFIAGTNGEVRPVTLLRMRVLPVFAETNTVNGREVDTLMYDYGLPYTNKLPVRKLKVVDGAM
jgi:hypothetical protein